MRFFFFFFLVFSFFLFQFNICRFPFLEDVDECTSSTPVCGIRFSCANTLGSFRCECKASGKSCQGKKSIYHMFIFVMAQSNPLAERWNHSCTQDILQNCLQEITKTQDIQVCIIISVLQMRTSSYDVTRPCENKKKIKMTTIIILTIKAGIQHASQSVGLCLSTLIGFGRWG